MTLLCVQPHRSASDDDAWLFKKAPRSVSFIGFIVHCVIESRNGVVVASEVTQARSRAEREAAVRMAGALTGVHQKTMCGRQEL